MPEEKIKELFRFIAMKKEAAAEYAKICGKDDPHLKPMLWENAGLDEAFQIVAGMSYTDYLIRNGGLMVMPIED